MSVQLLSKPQLRKAWLRLLESYAKVTPTKIKIETEFLFKHDHEKYAPIAGRQITGRRVSISFAHKEKFDRSKKYRIIMGNK